MGDADHKEGAVREDRRVGSPYDNESIAERLGGETFTTELDGLVFDGFRVPATDDVPATDASAAAPAGTPDGSPDGTPDGTPAGTPAGTSAPGPASAERPVAVLVHGWPQFAACWEDTARQLAAAGIDVIAYDQRGYSPGARPTDVADYALDRLLDDLDGLRRAWGLDRFHLVGHDWGGVLGWSYAVQHPEALATLTSVSTAHPVAHATRIAEDPDQYERMHYMRRIRKDPAGVEERMLADGGAKLAALYDGTFAEDRVQSYIDRFSQPGVLKAALAYYLAYGGARSEDGPVTVPTLYVWGSEDLAFTRGAAELTGQYVEGDYRFVEIPGASHWLPEQEPDVVAGSVIDWIREHP